MSTSDQSVPVIAERDLRFYLSGGYYNSDPANSLGGEISNFQLVSGKINGLFDNVNNPEALNGDMEYRCIYLKNTNQTRKLLGAKIWIETGTASANTAIAISVGGSGINGTEPAISNEDVAPPMQWFDIPLSQPDEPNIGDLWPGDKIGLWIRWSTNPNTAPIADDFAVIRIDGEREPESLTSPLPPPDEPPPEGCSAGNHWDPNTQQCIPNDIPIVCPTGYLYDEATQRCKPTVTPPASVPLIKFGAVSDTYPGSDTEDVFNIFASNLNTAAGNDTSFLLTAGDSTHIDGDVSDFIDFCRGLGAMFPNNIFPALGNHDDSEDGNASDGQDIIDAFPTMSSTGYYAVTRRNIRIIVMNTQASFTSSSAQATFVRTELQNATNDPAIKWKIMVFHKPIVTSDGNHAVEEELRDWLFPLMDTHHVDMIFSGHNHVYVRTKPIKFNASSPSDYVIVSDQTTGNYINQDGRVFFVVGTGGRRSNHTFDSDTAEAYIGNRRLPPPYGCCIFTLQDGGNQIAGQHITVGGQVYDSWILSKPGATPPPPEGTPTCPTGYFWDETAGRCLLNPQSCPVGQHWDKYQQRCVSDIITPPPTSPGYPVLNVVWYYESTAVQATTATITAGQHDATDGIILSSNESGVASTAISGGYINVKAGAGLGRIYVDYHLKSRYSEDTMPRFNIGMTFTYVYEGQASILVQDGNHPVTGFSVGGQTNYQFGGLNFTLFPNQIRSFAEYYHEANGDTISSVYPGNRTLVSGLTYKCFFSMRTNLTNESVILNVWQDFADGSGWVKIMTDRIWAQTNWIPGNVPAGVDELQVEQGPSHIERHHVLVGNNGTGPDLKIKDIKVGYLPFLPEGTNPPPVEPPPDGGGDPTTGEMDSLGILWYYAKGKTTQTIAQSRTAANDFRWSENASNVRQNGYEATAYFTFDGVASGGHFAQKMFGGNHSGDCQYEEDGSCCCWYDTGIRANGDVQFQIERPHPNNSSGTNPHNVPFSFTNIGVPMEGHTIGLKWVIFPVIPGGTSDNGGIHIIMWVDTSGFNAQGKPQNQWRKAFDVIDTGQIMSDYPIPDELELEIRNSDTDNTDDYAGGFQWRAI